MLPASKAPTVVTLLRVSNAASIVFSVVVSIASILFREVVSPPENILVVPSTISPPATVKSPTVFIFPVAWISDDALTTANSGDEPDTTTFLHCAI